MTLQIANVANAIAAISVSGLTIYDVDEIKDVLDVRDTPCLMPKPDGYVTDFEVTRDSYGAAAQAKRTVTYTLNYTLLYAPLGSGRGLFDVYDGMVGKAFAVIDAIMAQDATAVPLIEAGEPSQFGPVVDPAGNAYHGCIISVNVTEFVN